MEKTNSKSFKAVVILLGIFLGSFTMAGAVSIFVVQQGGTGVGTFTSSQLIYGNGTNSLSSVPTTTPSLGLNLSYSGTLGALVGGASGQLSISTSTLYGAGWTGGYVLAWNNGVPQFVATSTLSTITGTLTVAKGGTGTTTSTSGQLIYGGGAGVYQSVATSSATCGTGITCTAFPIIGTTNPSFILATMNAGVLGSVTSGVSPTSQATSTLYGGSSTGGFVLQWSNTAGGLVLAATSSASGTVTSIATNNGITGGTITTTGTIGLAALGSAGVLGAVTAAVPTVQATSTLYGPTATFLTTGLVGIASTTPWGLFSINPNNILSGAPSFVIGSSTATNLIVTNTGLVGIGTTSPSSLLSVSGTSGFMLTNTGAVNTVYIEDAANDTTPFVIDTSGNVGIGVQPGAKLEVDVDGSNITNTIYSSNRNAAAADVGSRLLFIGNGGSAQGGIAGAWNGAATTDGYISFYTRGSSNTTEKMRITSTGYVGIATTTPYSPLSVWGATTASGTRMQEWTNFASTTVMYLDNAGELVGTDQTNNWTGRISPTSSFVFQTGTTTTWTASTTGSAYSPYLVMPFAGTIRQIQCAVDSFLGVNIQIAGTNIAPSYFVASSTPGVINTTGSNTFTKGQRIVANYGTTTTATATSTSCTVSVTETP